MHDDALATAARRRAVPRHATPRHAARQQKFVEEKRSPWGAFLPMGGEAFISFFIFQLGTLS
jgi:hypothetical protein